MTPPTATVVEAGDCSHCRGLDWGFLPRLRVQPIHRLSNMYSMDTWDTMSQTVPKGQHSSETSDSYNQSISEVDKMNIHSARLPIRGIPAPSLENLQNTIRGTGGWWRCSWDSTRCYILNKLWQSSQSQATINMALPTYCLPTYSLPPTHLPTYLSTHLPCTHQAF